MVGQPIELVSQSQFPDLHTKGGSDKEHNQESTNKENTNDNLTQKLQQNMGANRVVIPPIPFKEAAIINGKHIVKWMEAEMKRMNMIENLNYAVIGKFSYG